MLLILGLKVLLDILVQMGQQFLQAKSHNLENIVIVKDKKYLTIKRKSSLIENK